MYYIVMNPEEPSNNINQRRSNDRNNNDDYHVRFNLNQYYNAVEDEQIYMDEYTTLMHRYNDFITSGNAMFTRMEQTLRENLSRTLVRQSFYYQRLNTSSHVSHSDSVPGIQLDIPSQRQIPIMEAPAPINTMNASPAPAPASASAPGQRQQVRERDNTSPQPQLPSNARFGDVFPRLISRYISSEINRNERQPNNLRENLFSMLYTVPVALRTNVNNPSAAGRSAPTNDQINRATLNTVFSNILSPVNATCPISRDEFNDDSQITMIRGCNHIFNRESLREWFVNHATCPMCRNDIRDYRPSSLVSEPEQRENRDGRIAPAAGSSAGVIGGGAPANISIDRVDDNQITFSYDIPIQYNDDDVYRNLLNTITNMAETSQQNNRPSQNQDDDDILDVD
jgi:hypothetical protein